MEKSLALSSTYGRVLWRIHDGTWRSPTHPPRAYSPDCVEGGFSEGRGWLVAVASCSIGGKSRPALRESGSEKEDTLCLPKRTRRPSGASLRRCSTPATLS